MSLAEGAKNDQGKPRTDLLDPDFLLGISTVLSFGAEKYAAHNWRKGISFSRVLGGILRHVYAILRGEDTDSESGLRHTYHAACGLMFLSWYLDHKKEYDDRYKY